MRTPEENTLETSSSSKIHKNFVYTTYTPRPVSRIYIVPEEGLFFVRLSW